MGAKKKLVGVDGGKGRRGVEARKEEDFFTSTVLFFGGEEGRCLLAKSTCSRYY